MKVYKKAPVEQAMVVVDNHHTGPGQGYLLYTLTPKLIGRARRERSGRVKIDDFPNTQFPNLLEALAFVLFRIGKQDLANRIKAKLDSEETFTGLRLIELDKWNAFCAIRKLPPGSNEAIQATYSLSDEECKKLGLTSSKRDDE